MGEIKLGEIYFVREFDFLTRKESPYVKIGLVHSPKTSEERLKEHQTGNPNVLKVFRPEEIVTTEAVDLVEAQMHRRFAQHRVSGEWFQLNERQRTGAVAVARQLASEASELPELLKAAEKLNEATSNGKEKQPSDEILAAVRELLIAKGQLKVLDALNKEIMSMFSVAIATGADVAGAAARVERTYKPKLLVEHINQIAIDLPEIHEKYLTDITKIAKRFTITYKEANLALGEAFESGIEQIRAKIAEAKKKFDPFVVNEAALILTDLRGVAEWHQLFAETRIKIECGRYETIAGVCKWHRAKSVESVFQTERFITEKPEIAEKYMKPKETKSHVAVAKNKATKS